MRAGLAVLLLLVALPTVAATGVTGRLDVRGQLLAPAAATISSIPLAMFVNGTSSIDIHGTSPQAFVRVFEDHYFTANVLQQRPIVVTQTDRPTWSVHDVDVTILPGLPGWLGVHPNGGQLLESSHDRAVEILESQSPIGNGHGTPDASSPGQPYYLVQFPASSVARESDAWTYRGPASLKVMGPSLTIRSRENTTTIQTGEMQDPSNPAQTLRRLVVIELDATILNASGTPTQVGSGEMIAAWDGDAQFFATRGTLASNSNEWLFTGGEQTVNGNFTATITPIDADLTISLVGDLRDSSMTTKVALPNSSRVPVILLVAAGAVVLGGVSTVILRATSRNRRLIEPDEYATLAAQAADAQDYPRSLRLIARARESSPASVRLAIEEAHYLALAGKKEAAVRKLSSSFLAEDADALMLLATLHAEANEDGDAAAALIRALSCAPSLVVEIEGDPNFKTSLRRQDVRAAVRGARDKIL